MSTDYRVLGELEVLRDGERVELGSRRQRALLVRLLIARGGVITADRLVEDLWQGDPPETARHTLHVYVSRLRKLLSNDGARLERDGSGYRFHIELDELDAARFERLANEGRAARERHDLETATEHFAEALALWRGPALGDIGDEEFAREEALRLEELRLATLEERFWVELETGHQGLASELQDVVSQHPFRETFWEQLMLALYRAGRQADALRTYQEARRILAAEIGIEPGPALQRMEERIVAQDPALEPAGAGSPSPAELPLQRTSFVGREHELAMGANLLARSRLLTLTGAPGAGKTRLALRLAADHGDRYAHGVFFIPVASITTPRLLEGAVAQALDLREVAGESTLDGVKAFLADREVLMVLDNFEQVLRAAPFVGELLDSAPLLTVLVTSRSPLGIAGEQEFPIPPMGVPPEVQWSEVEAVADYDAVALFVTRAQAADPSFLLADRNVRAVAAITARLDGLPLAIELAAARTKLLTPDDLRDRLDQRLTLLTTGPGDGPDRHRTMRDAIAWSYDLLEPKEQAFFRRLGVFDGSFTIDAAGRLSGLPEGEVLDGLDALLAQSLLYRPVDVGEARFAMLAMIRELALDELEAAGDLDESRRLHARYFLDLAQQAEHQLTHEPDSATVQRLGMDIDNLRAALRYSLESNDPDLGLDLASAIWRFWQRSDLFTEGQEWLAQLLGRPDASREARARGLSAAAGLAYWLGEYDEATTHYEAALELYRAAGDRFNEADTLYAMSLTAGWQDDLAEAERLATEARAGFEAVESQEGVGRALLGQAFVVWKRGDLAGAKAAWEEALGIVREAGDQALANTALVGLASLTFQLGDSEEAMGIVIEGVVEAAESGNAHITVWMMDFVAAFAVEDMPAESVRLAGAADSLRKDAGGGILPASLGVDDARTAAADVLSPAELESAWVDGQALTLDEAVKLARVVAASMASSQTR